MHFKSDTSTIITPDYINDTIFQRDAESQISRQRAFEWQHSLTKTMILNIVKSKIKNVQIQIERRRFSMASNRGRLGLIGRRHPRGRHSWHLIDFLR